VRLLDVVRDSTLKIPSLVTEYVDAADNKLLFSRFTEADVRFYMFELLKVQWSAAFTTPVLLKSEIGTGLLSFEGYYASV
jgi:hypothetical protein